MARERLPSNVCHWGNRDVRPHLIRTHGITSLGRLRRSAMEVSVRGLMSVLYDPQRSSGCTQLHSLIAALSSLMLSPTARVTTRGSGQSAARRSQSRGAGDSRALGRVPSDLRVLVGARRFCDLADSVTSANPNEEVVLVHSFTRKYPCCASSATIRPRDVA